MESNAAETAKFRDASLNPIQQKILPIYTHAHYNLLKIQHKRTATPNKRK